MLIFHEGDLIITWFDCFDMRDFEEMLTKLLSSKEFQ